MFLYVTLCVKLACLKAQPPTQVPTPIHIFPNINKHEEKRCSEVAMVEHITLLEDTLVTCTLYHIMSHYACCSFVECTQPALKVDPLAQVPAESTLSAEASGTYF